tara:strand:+ start:5215 stop:6246 length:1032 start_codon:yes stop_codon:yes gene_type:complete
MLGEKQYKELKKELDECQRPLFFFDDDPDGLSAFLLFYRYKGEGKGIIVKTHPKLDLTLLPKVEEYNPDKIFILDVAVVEQEFVDKCKRPVIWVDHHGPSDINNVKYFNPRLKDKGKHCPTSELCYGAVKQDQWIAAVGTVADWFYTDSVKKFQKKNPKLIPEDLKKAPDVIYNSRLGTLIRVFSFILKGTTNDAMKYIKVLTRINDPEEILSQTTAQGKFIWKRFVTINELYQRLWKDARQAVGKETLVPYVYDANVMSFSADISNEMIYRNPDKVVLVARKKNGEVKGSLRCGTKRVLPPILEKSLMGIEGYGGGHEQACGFCVKEEDFYRFIANLKRELD